MKKQGPSQTIRYAGGYEDHPTEGAHLKRIVAGGRVVATRVTGGPNAGTYFVHPDHLGSLNVLTNGAGAEVQRLTYRPFGETQSNTGSVDFDQHRFTGQEQDPETGLYFYQARYYNPVLGRFLSPDSVVPAPGDPQSLNRYSYVENNPVTRIDPSGHSWLSKFLRSFGGSLLGIVLGLAMGLTANFLGGGLIVSGILGGFTAGAVTTAISGGNPLLNVGLGAVFGGVAGAVGGPLFGVLKPLGDFGAAVATGAILGAAFGGIGAAAAGQNILQGMFGGALAGALLAAAVYGGCKAFEGISSRALEQGGSPDQGSSWPEGVRPPGLPSADTLPLDGTRVTTEFGGTTPHDAFHRGLDMTGNLPMKSTWGEPTYATQAGDLNTSIRGSFRLVVDQNTTIFYTHVVPDVHILNGGRVSPGELIGYLANVGRATGPHLDFRVLYQGKWVDPRLYLGLPPEK